MGALAFEIVDQRPREHGRRPNVHVVDTKAGDGSGMGKARGGRVREFKS